MRYQGASDTGINATWWVCMGVLLRQGMMVADTMDALHAAAQENCQDDRTRRTGIATSPHGRAVADHEPEFVHSLDAPL